LSLETGQKKILIEGGMCPRYSPTGHLVYARGGSLLAVPFDLKKLAVSGQPFPVVDGVFMSVRTGMAAFAISANGDLAYAPGPVDGGERLPFWVDRKGAGTPFPLPPRSYLHPRLSPDDRQLAMEVEGPIHDSYFYDISRGALSRFSFDGSTHWPVWTARGDRITFRSGRTRPMSMWWMPADRSGAEERLLPAGPQTQNPESWSPDGRALLFTRLQPGSGADIFVLLLDGDRQPRPLVQTKFDEGSPKFSPDGKWVAYCSSETGRMEVYVTPYPGPGAKILVSTDGGFDPVWRRKGGELYYRREDSMMVVSVATQPSLTLSKPRVLWDGHYRRGTSSTCGGAGATSTNYDVTADGERFVMIQDKAENIAARQVNVVLGWAEELKRAAPARN
jgi:eukaryotic-like serine/threonine-protein kinase